MIKVKKLSQGSRIAIISPSCGVPYLYPDTYELGLRNLKEQFGLEIVEMPTARMSPDELYRNPKLRADDINNAFADKSIDGIISSIGGYESVRILKYLDIELILKNPKLIMGFSDATTFLAYLNYLGMVTFYGPSIMAGFAQIKSLPVEFAQHIRNIMFGGEFPYVFEPYKAWTNGYKDWNNKAAPGECTEFHENKDGWTFLQGRIMAEGKLWGGCIEVLEFLKSTVYWPDESFWSNRILFFETSEDKPLPDQVGYMLRNYGIQGILNKVKGIVFARPKDYSDKEKEKLHKIILDIMQIEFAAPDIPVVVNMDFGHTDPKLILPMGCRIRLDPLSNGCILLDNPFDSN